MHISLIIIFIVVIVSLLCIDLFYNKKAHKVSIKEALIWSLIWIGTALVFSVCVGLFIGDTPGTTTLPTVTSWDKSMLFLTSYIIEKTLSVDNLFVFIMIFAFFKVPDEYHHKVLLYGILGAIILRALFIFGGMGLIEYTEITILGHTINWLLTIFGFVLIWAAWKTVRGGDEDETKDFNTNIGVRIIKKIFPVVPRYDGGNFFTLENGKKAATMLLLVVATIEASDLIFAVDSIPACLGVLASTQNLTYWDSAFLLYTSNIFAILGLRQLYFLLAAIKDKFIYLSYGIGIVLAFIGVKMIIADFVHISSPISLIVVAGVLVGSIVISMLHKKEVTIKAVTIDINTGSETGEIPITEVDKHYTNPLI